MDRETKLIVTGIALVFVAFVLAVYLHGQGAI